MHPGIRTGSMFADRLIDATRQFGPLCLGIDPHAGRVPTLFGGDTPEGLAAWGEALVALAAGRVGVVKPQVGLFERLGPAGLVALQAVCRAASEAGLLVIADAKRGDIGSTAEGYAAAWLADGAPFACDALTVNPYLGLDTLVPFLRTAAATGRGLAVLVRTSNPGAADFQARDLEGAPLHVRIAEALAAAGADLTGESGWSGLMMVVGATGPEEARMIRRFAPNNLFLVPGYGAQGAGASDALAGLVAGPHGLEGGVVNASRAVTFPPAADAATTLDTWREEVAAAIEAAQADLRAAAGA